MKFGIDHAVLGLTGGEDIDLLSADVDVAFWGKDIAASLLIGFPCTEIDVAFDAAIGGRCAAGGGGLLILALFLAADGDTKTTGAEEARFFFVLVITLAAGVSASE